MRDLLPAGHVRISKGDFQRLVHQQEAAAAVSTPYRTESGSLRWLARLLRARACRPGRRPYVVGIAGGVAVGKTTLARQLSAMLGPNSLGMLSESVSVDGFLYPNRALENRGKMHRKGFPDSFDVPRLLAFLAAVKRDDTVGLRVPVYSQRLKDVQDGVHRQLRAADVVLLEGVNLLAEQFFHYGNAFAVRDFADCLIYLDAPPATLRAWFKTRFDTIRHARQTPDKGLAAQLRAMPEAAFTAHVERIWSSVNAQLLAEDIVPYRSTADLVLRKRRDHRIQTIYMRPDRSIRDTRSAASSTHSEQPTPLAADESLASC